MKATLWQPKEMFPNRNIVKEKAGGKEGGMCGSTQEWKEVFRGLAEALRMLKYFTA